MNAELAMIKNVILASETRSQNYPTVSQSVSKAGGTRLKSGLFRF